MSKLVLRHTSAATAVPALSLTLAAGEAERGSGKATVPCGNIPTANATVYVIDTVLMP